MIKGPDAKVIGYSVSMALAVVAIFLLDDWTFYDFAGVAFLIASYGVWDRVEKL